MIALVALLVVVAVALSVALSALLHAPMRRVLPAFRRIEPVARIVWLAGLASLPAVAAALLVGAALLPCAREITHGGAIDPLLHSDEICRICLAHPMHVLPVAWVLAALVLARPAIVLGSAVRGVAATRRAAVGLRAVAIRYARDVLLVPGFGSFVVGCPDGTVCLGEGLVTALPAPALDAVLAHERAHVRRRDVVRKLAVRALGALHLPATARALVAEIDLAIEQACDREASRVLDDPLAVADALLRVARLADFGQHGLIPAITGSSLESRVEALVEPDWRRVPHAPWAVCAALLALATAFAASRTLHHALEALVEHLVG